MRIAIISDIHSNPVALENTLQDAEEQGCERVVCLGDIVGYGYNPNACIDICRERHVECLLGNHDAGVIGKLGLDWFNPYARDAIDRQKPLVTDANKAWLMSLPYSCVEVSGHKAGEEKNMRIAYAHGSYTKASEFNYIQDFIGAYAEMESLMKLGIKALFVGHTHFATAFFYGGVNSVETQYLDIEDEEEMPLDWRECSIVNVGSCGYPRNQPYTVYGIYDDNTNVFKYRALPFDFVDYADRMKKAGLPLPLWVPTLKAEADRKPIQYR